MQMVIKIPDVPIEDYQDLFKKIYGMAASEGLFDDKVKSQRALALKAVLDILGGITNGTPLPKGHGRLIILSEDAVKREQTPLSFSCQNWISEAGLSNATVAIIEANGSEEK